MCKNCAAMYMIYQYTGQYRTSIIIAGSYTIITTALTVFLALVCSQRNLLPHSQLLRLQLLRLWTWAAEMRQQVP